MKKYISILFIICAAYTMPAQSRYTPATPAGTLYVNTPLSSTPQSVRDRSSLTPIKLSTTKMYLGNATGSGLLNFPDTANSIYSGIWFGSGSANLYRNATNSLCTDGFFNVKAPALTGSSATSALSIYQTWNTTGNPSLIFANVTNTASGFNSNLMDLQINSQTIYKFTKNGNLDFNNGTSGGITFGNNASKGVFYESSSSSNTIYSQYTSHIFKVFNGSSYAQRLTINNTGLYVGSGTIKASSAVEVESTTQGFLTPRMTTAQKLAIASPAEGLEVYDLTLHKKSYYDGTTWINY